MECFGCKKIININLAKNLEFLSLENLAIRDETPNNNKNFPFKQGFPKKIELDIEFPLLIESAKKSNPDVKIKVNEQHKITAVSIL